MAAGGGGLSKADRRRAEDLELAGWIGGEFGLGTIDQVVRQWRDRGRLLSMGWGLVGATLVFGTWGLLVWLQSKDRLTREFVGVPIGSVAVLAVLLIALGERFKVMGCWYFLYSGGVAQVARSEPKRRVLRWPEVETVTIILKTDSDGNPRTEVDRCVLAGPGTEITAGPGVGLLDEDPGRILAAAAHRNLAPRLVPPLIQAWESGEPVTAGELSIGQEGITMPGWHPPRLEPDHVDGGHVCLRARLGPDRPNRLPPGRNGPERPAVLVRHPQRDLPGPPDRARGHGARRPRGRLSAPMTAVLVRTRGTQRLAGAVAGGHRR